MLQPTDTGSLSGSKFPRTIERITGQKSEVTKSYPKWFCKFFYSINKSRCLGLQIHTTISFLSDSSLFHCHERTVKHGVLLRIVSIQSWKLGHCSFSKEKRFSFLATPTTFLSSFVYTYYLKMWDEGGSFKLSFLVPHSCNQLVQRQPNLYSSLFFSLISGIMLAVHFSLSFLL